MFWKKLKLKTIGFSIIELLIIIILIGILVAIIIPRIATRTELARQKTAMADLEMIASAEERAIVDTGYLYRLYVLDDIAGDGDDIGQGGINDVKDALKDEYNPYTVIFNNVYQNPVQIFLYPDSTTDIVNSGNFVDAGRALELFRSIHLNETAFNWNGPYLVLQKDKGSLPWGYTLGGDDVPDDPWGNNYLLFTRRGLVYEDDGMIYSSIIFPSNGNTYNCQIFDRTTILSLGKNGLPGDGSIPSSDPAHPGNFGQGDDIFRQF